MNTLTEGNKQRLRQLIIDGADCYNSYFVGKDFEIVCEDGMHVCVHFYTSDFQHLTGIYSDLGENDFYSNCLNKTIETKNINTEQKYNWTTLRQKCQRLPILNQLLYGNGEKRILLKGLQTNTLIFPVAIKNDECDICIGFVSSVLKARSMRKAGNSNYAEETKKIVAIFKKQSNAEKYDSLIYKSGVDCDPIIFDRVKELLNVDTYNLLINVESQDAKEQGS